MHVETTAGLSCSRRCCLFLTPGRDAASTVLDLVLIRHGQPADTAPKTFLGCRSDPGLGPLGQSQAGALAAQVPGLLTVRPARVISSPLRRARETAGPVAERLDLPVEIAPALREIDFGHWDGLREDDLTARWPEAAAWVREPWRWRPPGGEDFADLDQRVGAWLDGLRAEQPRGVVVVVAHFCPICCLAARLLGLPLQRAVSLRLGRGEAGRISAGGLRWWGLPQTGVDW